MFNNTFFDKRSVTRYINDITVRYSVVYNSAEFASNVQTDCR